MYLCRVYLCPDTCVMAATKCGRAMSKSSVVQYQDTMTMVENAVSMPVMEKCGGKHICRATGCRASIVKAFLSYALAEAMYDKNAY